MQGITYRNSLWPTLMILLCCMGLFAAIYPWAVSFILQSFFPYKANGSFIVLNNVKKPEESSSWSNLSSSSEYLYSANEPEKIYLSSAANKETWSEVANHTKRLETSNI